MKASSLVAVSLVLVAFAGVALAGPGPTSPLYLTYFGPNIAVVQGNSITSFPVAYGAPNEEPIAVWGDVRTTGYFTNSSGGQYTLAGAPTGTTYALPSPVSLATDSTSDSSHNYLVDYNSGIVYQTARDFTNPTALFTVTPGKAGITYDATNNSLWISSWDQYSVADYSLTGTVLSSFVTPHKNNGALALDPADQTLWLVDFYGTGDLEQYSQGGVLLSTGPYVGYAYGGEFNLQPTTTPEPGSLILFGSGIFGLAGVLRRKINL